MKETLPVFVGSREVGSLTSEGKGARLDYRNGATEVVFRLPVSTESYVADVGVPPFFANLLPEGDSFVRLARALGVSGEDLLGMFERTGGDAPGRVSVGTTDRSAYRVDLTEGFVAGYEAILSHGSGAVDTLPGAQLKISARSLTLPATLSAGPGDFVKFTETSRYPRLAENEHFFMKLASSTGIEAARTRLLKDGIGHTGLLVERFDRTVVRGRVDKLRMEDGCQLLDRLPDEKERVTAEELGEAFRAVVKAPAVSLYKLWRQIVFRILIGDSDGHAKNYSVLEGDGGIIDTSPLYDCLCARIYGQDGCGLASVAGEEDEPGREHLLALAETFGVPERLAVKTIGTMTPIVRKAIPTLAVIGFDEDTTARLAKLLAYRCDLVETG